MNFGGRIFPGLVLLAVLAFCSIPEAYADELSPREVVDAFHGALRAGDPHEALGFLSARAVIFEGGGAELTLDEYASYHLGMDIRLAQATRRRVTHEAGSNGPQYAWFLSQSEISGTFQGMPVNQATTETMILSHLSGRWQIVHIHWSSQRLRSPISN
ncbi:MAG: nuclear transport factor 2 family protein [Myxococcota bacterium]|jgi:hypothetical protein|nr:nuclear transport factor 2 family protein [Myxococcota bacterium]